MDPEYTVVGSYFTIFMDTSTPSQTKTLYEYEPLLKTTCLEDRGSF